MAIQVWDGFDHYDDASDFLARSGKLQYTQSNGTASFVTPGREGNGKALTIQSETGGGRIAGVFYQRVASAFVGFAAFMPAGETSPVVFNFYDSIGENNQVSVMFRFDNYSITVFRGNAFIGSSTYFGDGGGAGTQLAITGNNAFTPNVWNFIEVWPVINGSTGSVEVRLNSVTIAALTVTGANTQVSGNAWWDTLELCSDTSEPDTFLIDDLYYGDTTEGVGSYPGTVPIGDCHVQTLFPVGNGSVQFTPLANANWQEVSETAMDSDTSYNYDSTVGNEDLFNFAALPSNTTLIYGIQVTGAYRKDDSGARQVKQGVKSGAAETYGADWSLSEANYVYFTDQWILDPNTSANWATAAVNALSAGYNVAS
jgi:hypothetical protein